MRANGRKYQMGRRFAILIAVAAAGVMALGAQTGAQATEVVEYDSKVTIGSERNFYYGGVESELRECELGREVILFRPRPGPDRKLATTRTHLHNVGGVGGEAGAWRLHDDDVPSGPVYAEAPPVVGDGFVCRADRSKTYDNHYDTRLTINKLGTSMAGEVESKVRKCRVGREVIVFKKRPGPDRKLGATRSGARRGHWRVYVGTGSRIGRLYAKATPKVGDGFVCRPGYSRVHLDL
jgi:hypothetical protein